MSESQSKSIKAIFDEIRSESGSNRKIEILKENSSNPILKQVLYNTYSNRVKYHIKQIPEYKGSGKLPLSWALEHLDDIKNREVTGNSAIDHLRYILESVSADDSHVIERIIEKDAKIGMAKKNINKVFPELIENTPYQGAQSFSEKRAKDIIADGPAISQIKMDGRYCNAIIQANQAFLESRSGEPTIILGATILDELSHLDDCVLNGELTIDGVDRNTSNGIINSIISISKKIQEGEPHSKDIDQLEKRHGMSYNDALKSIRFTLWDKITIDEYFNGYSDVKYQDRLDDLKDWIESKECSQVSIVEGKEVNSYSDAMNHFVSALSRGLEGTILKSAEAPWKDGKPKWQIKMKLEIDLDMEIIGFNYGTPGTKNENVISSLTVQSSCGKVVTRPGGIDESTMTWITQNQSELMGSIVTMKCCGLSHDNDGNYSTLHPVFKSIRDDKDEADSLEKIIEIEDAAKTLS
jgi:DNA ligase-1